MRKWGIGGIGMVRWGLWLLAHNLSCDGFLATAFDCKGVLGLEYPASDFLNFFFCFFLLFIYYGVLDIKDLN